MRAEGGGQGSGGRVASGERDRAGGRCAEDGGQCSGGRFVGGERDRAGGCGAEGGDRVSVCRSRLAGHENKCRGIVRAEGTFS